MASLSNFSFLVLLLLGTRLIAIATGGDHVDIAIPPGSSIIEAVVDDYVDIAPVSTEVNEADDDEVEVPVPTPEGSPQDLLLLEGCWERLVPKCRQEAMKAIFEDGNSISRDCCFGLREELGKECHDALVKYAAPRLPVKYNFDYYVKRGQQECDRCEEVTQYSF
ncbi:unnamed protein product [Dovyalis caffra]|uniref:Prolamin-like domain-containing protein n=1 Tax=Dovyalis caffra TaxID=77055 RepID=A0AAV1RAJ2_9ROSI|nr:unnamed protein product [Dovyalis caffra]